ncbi:TIGR02680 family protein [Kineococcus arenarius]|uniref:TIGR02680 family protein n=1 Tax=Kineococcus sp. SYSU DK007 TaxID=3383128 RepID=UPI003D7C390A
MNPAPPRPSRSRWQPLRAGLVDLYHYDDEEFRFHDGRLLLRGNNGAGKSKVLALTLPFLLDADLSAHRVEPDGDRGKRMEWNLLLGGAHPHTERTGYTWLELGRRAADGTEEFRTLGCGMKAVTGRGIARHWFFSTTARCGEDLHLVDRTGTALPRDRLVDVLGASGTVFDSRGAYRRHVDETFFRLGEDRYGALVDLLIQLRQPQLTKRPDERALSAALTEALPPVDPGVLADVAEAFRTLEDDRHDLQAVLEARDAAAAFEGHYRRYARAAAKRRTRELLTAHSRYERHGRDLRRAASEREEADARLTAAERDLHELQRRRTELDEEHRVLAGDTRLSELAEAENSARLAATAATDARGRAEDTARSSASAAAQLTEREGTGERARAELAAADEALRAAATGAGVPRPPGAPDPADGDADAEGHHAALLEVARRRRTEAEHVRALLRELEGARARVATRQAERDRAAARADGAAARVTEAQAAVEAATAAHLDAARTALEAATELALDDPAGVLDETRWWAATLDGRSPLATAADSAHERTTRELAAARAAADLRARDLTGRVRDLNTERERLLAGEDTAPHVPRTRPADRRGRPGAPLWQVVDFAPEVPESERAGLEAALEAAGLLDAWISPDASLRTAPDGDVLLTAGAAVAGDSLLGVLVPAVDRADAQAAALSDEAVAAVLTGISRGSADGAGTGVGVDGSFHLGVLTGRWGKPRAEFVGRGARESARRERLAALEAELAALTVEVADAQAEVARIDRRGDVLAAERRALPDEAPLHAAHAERTSAEREARRAAEDVTRAGEVLEESVAAAREVELRTAGEARDVHLVPESAAVEAVLAAVAEFRERAGDLRARLREAVRAHAELVRARTEAQRAADEAERAAAVQRDREQDAAAAQARLEALRSTTGAEVAELQRRLGEVRAALDGLAGRLRAADAERSAATRALGVAEGDHARLTGQSAQAEADRDAAVAALQRFTATGVVAATAAGVDAPDRDAPWAASPAVQFARRLDAAIPEELDEGEFQRAQTALSTEVKKLNDTLARRGNSALLSVAEGAVVVEVRFAGRATSVHELRTDLDADAGERQRLLDAREREVLENHLVAEVAAQLQALIRAAEEHVLQMNTELEQRPTSTGMRLRMQWLPVEDGPAGLAEARRRLLRQSADAWSAQDRTAVGEFLQRRIQAVRQDSTAGTWLEHLTNALDYRRWHRFAVQRHQNGQWRPATGPASGGERVLAASVPLFAAASAHYRSAGNPDAPRIITLDEAFAGVDDTARADYLGLLAEFDLDVVMTSEREWACYPQVPGIGICQLSRKEGVDAVLVTSFRWDGRAREQVPRTAAPATAPAPPRQQPGAEQDDLFS